MRQIVGVAAVFGLLTAGAVLAQDGPITIKLKKAGAGDVVKETKTETTDQKVTITVQGNAQPPKEEKAAAAYTYTDEVIEKAAGSVKPTKVKRTYESAELTIGDQKQDLGLKGKTVLIERKGDKYTFTSDDKPVTGKAAELLGKEFTTKKQTSDEDFLPGKPVKVGESWTLDVSKVAAELSEGGMVIDTKKSNGTGKLVKAYDQDGKKFGVIEVAMELVVTKLASGPQEIPLKDGSKLTLNMTLDGCIDGSTATGGGKMTMKGNLSGEIMNVAQIALDVNVGMTGKTVQIKK